MWFQNVLQEQYGVRDFWLYQNYLTENAWSGTWEWFGKILFRHSHDVGFGETNLKWIFGTMDGMWDWGLKKSYHGRTYVERRRVRKSDRDWSRCGIHGENVLSTRIRKNYGGRDSWRDPKREQNPLMVWEVGQCWKKESRKSVHRVGYRETTSKLVNCFRMWREFKKIRNIHPMVGGIARDRK